MTTGPSPKIHKLIQESFESERSGDIGAAIQTARDAFEQADSHGGDRERAAALACLAYLYNHIGKFDEALKLAEDAVGLSGDDPKVQVDALTTQGICLSDLGRLAQTEQRLLAAMELAREQGYLKAIQKCLHVLSAGVYLPRGQFELAIAADEESLHIAEELDLHDLRWFPLVTLGWMYWATGKRPQALRTLKS